MSKYYRYLGNSATFGMDNFGNGQFWKNDNFGTGSGQLWKFFRTGLERVPDRFGNFSGQLWKNVPL